MVDRYRAAALKLAVAGRELGGGPSEAVKRVVPGLIEGLFAQERRRWDNHHPRTKERWPWDEEKALAAAGQRAYGVAVGLVMAGDEQALAVLAECYEEWRRETSG